MYGGSRAFGLPIRVTSETLHILAYTWDQIPIDLLGGVRVLLRLGLGLGLRLRLGLVADSRV